MMSLMKYLEVKTVLRLYSAFERNKMMMTHSIVVYTLFENNKFCSFIRETTSPIKYYSESVVK